MPSKFSDKAEPHYLRARAYEEAERWADALREYRRALRIKKDLLPARKRLGDLHRRRGELAEALREYEKAAELARAPAARLHLPERERVDRREVLQAYLELLSELGRAEEANAVRRELSALR